MTLSGNYEVSAVDQQGNPMGGGRRIIAAGGSIYTVRNALCINNPGSIVHIKSVETGNNLDSESPYQCPN